MQKRMRLSPSTRPCPHTKCVRARAWDGGGLSHVRVRARRHRAHPPAQGGFGPARLAAWGVGAAALTASPDAGVRAIFPVLSGTHPNVESPPMAAILISAARSVTWLTLRHIAGKDHHGRQQQAQTYISSFWYIATSIDKSSTI